MAEVHEGSPQQSQQVDKQQIQSRRTTIKRIVSAGLAVGFGVAAWKTRNHNEPKNKNGVTIESRPTQIPTSSPTPTPETTQTPEATPNPEQIRIDALNQILQTELFSPQRDNLEKEYADKAKTKQDTDQGLWAIQNHDVRLQLLRKRFEIRQNGDPRETGLQKLPSDLVAWAQRNNIEPEVLGVSKDAHGKAQKLLKKLIPKIKMGVNPDTIDPQTLMLSPGGFAKLIQTETAGFTNIGDDKASFQLNESQSARQNALANLLTALNDETGLKYEYSNIPGSTMAAVGGQFLPEQAQELRDLFKGAGEAFNPFDIEKSVMGMAVLIARDVGAARSGGFVEGDKDRQESGISNWYGARLDEVDDVLAAHNDYRERFRE